MPVLLLCFMNPERTLQSLNVTVIFYSTVLLKYIKDGNGK